MYRLVLRCKCTPFPANDQMPHLFLSATKQKGAGRAAALPGVPLLVYKKPHQRDVMKLRLNTGFEGAIIFVILRLLSTLRSRPAIDYSAFLGIS